MLTTARLHALANLISGLGVDAHADVMRFLEESGSPFTRNNNGVFVDLCALEPKTIEGLHEIAARHESLAEADTGQEEASEHAAVPWVGHIETKTVIERADEVIRKHMMQKCSSRVLFDTTARRRNPVQRKTFINMARKNEIYDPCLNTLQADE